MTDVALAVAEKMKPLLVKLVPINLLRRVKKNIVDSEMAKLKGTIGVLPFNRKTYPDGVNLIGYIQGEIGLGQSCRLTAQFLDGAQIPFTVYNYQQVSDMRFNDRTWGHKITNTTPYNINVMHINPYEMPLAFIRMGRELLDKRYNIAYWAWELEKFPEEWENAFNLVDEIWTPSDFVSDSIKQATNKPVHTVPHCFNTPDTGDYTRKNFNLPEDKFLFLCMYDCNSSIERKNPLGAIKAYKQAFLEKGNDISNFENVGLVIKVNNPQQHEISRIKEELEGYPNIYIIPEIFDRTQVNGLIACVDVYVSLHRSEGFGLVMAEAMMLGVPTIATGWSGNMEFMNNEVACMVDHKLIEIEQDCGQYKAGNRWAEPDTRQAANFMKKLSEDRAFYLDILEKAKLHTSKHLAPSRAIDIIKGRISEIYSKVDGENK